MGIEDLCAEPQSQRPGTKVVFSLLRSLVISDRWEMAMECAARKPYLAAAFAASDSDIAMVRDRAQYNRAGRKVGRVKPRVTSVRAACIGRDRFCRQTSMDAHVTRQITLE